MYAGETFPHPDCKELARHGVQPNNYCCLKHSDGLSQNRHCVQAKRSHAVIVLTVPVIVAFKTVTGLGPDHYCVVESRDCPRAILFKAMTVLGLFCLRP